VSSWAVRAVAAAPSFQTCFACVHMYILYACVYICVCVYVCGHDICVYMHVCMYLYIYAFIHVCMVYVYTYLCIDCGSWYQCCGRCHACAYVFVCICMRIHMCVGISICTFFFVESVTCSLQVLWALVHRPVCMLHRCVFTPTYISATHSLQVVHICVYVYKCVYACICIWMHMCVYDIA